MFSNHYCGVLKPHQMQGFVELEVEWCVQRAHQLLCTALALEGAIIAVFSFVLSIWEK